MRKKEKSAAVQQALLNGGSLFPLSFFDSRTYIQHNVRIADGLGAILEFMDVLPRDNRSVRVHLAVEDGDFSFVHNDYRLGALGPMAGFEVHRWVDGRIVEHWDNLQSMPDAPNPAGRTMCGGGGNVCDLEKGAANKVLVERFTREICIGRNMEALDSYFSEGSLIQHNPGLPDGTDALRSYLASGMVTYEILHRVIGEGNFVLAMAEGLGPNERGEQASTSFYDLYRLADGFIVEHWDVVEVIAPRDEWRNTHGKF
jgi:predicted SnoaL-like aldol condensation-catalyzing enzyme